MLPRLRGSTHSERRNWRSLRAGQSGRGISLLVMRIINCQQCGAGVPILNLSPELERNISETRRVGLMQALIKLKEHAGLTLPEAKAVTYHLCDDGAKCHRCHHELLDEKKEVNCPQCGSLNLKW